MIKAIIELSKYILTFNILFYVLISYIILFVDEKKRFKFILFFQDISIFIGHITGSLVLLYTRRDIYYLLIPLLQMIALFAFIVLSNAIYQKSNRLIVNHTAMLMSIGFIMLLRLDFNKGLRQFGIVAVSMIISLIIPALFKKMNIIYQLKWGYIVTGIILLLVVIITGNITHGSKLAFSIGGFSFQPSEFVKILLVLFLAVYLAEDKSFKHVVVSAVLIGTEVIILVLSRDLGSALIFFTTYILMVFVITNKKIYVVGGLLGAILASVISYYIFPHVRVRVSSWLNPWLDIDNKGYQITQSLFGIGTGGWFGMGLDEGYPKSIPYVEKDFIFSAICEEYGVIFGICLIAICINLFIEIIHVGKKCEEEFYKYSAYGLGIIYVSQLFLTIGGNVKFIPLTGVTLPLISYGGSSVLASMILISIVQGLDVHHDFYMTEEYPEIINLPINVVSVCYSVFFVFISLYIAHFVQAESDQIINNSYNLKRQDIIAAKTIRGDILAKDGTVLATTKIEEGKEKRIYPFDNLYSHIVGYSINGKMGVESDANMSLVSSDISLENKIQDDLIDNKHKGNNVYTTIDPVLQKAAYDALGYYYGAIIITEPSTGKILALVSKPDFDPNEIGQIWDKLINDKDSSVLLNRVTQGMYPPGSTFKILTALEYLQENNGKYESYHFNCKGKLKKDNNVIHCFHNSNHGEVDFKKSFAKSCNSSFANIGLSLDADCFSKKLENLYFNKSIPANFHVKESSVKIGNYSQLHDIMQTAIGQGTTQITPFHLAMITSMIANNGEMVCPYVIDRIESADGKLLKQNSKKSLGVLISEEDAKIMQELMVSVVEEGTGHRLKNKDYKVAGKTGSAEYNSHSDSHAWFTGFTYDTQNPLQITIILEAAGSGGEYAVPMAGKIFDQYYNYK